MMSNYICILFSNFCIALPASCQQWALNSDYLCYEITALSRRPQIDDRSEVLLHGGLWTVVWAFELIRLGLCTTYARDKNFGT